MSQVQTPIIPVVAEWTRNMPGTLSLGQGMVSYPPPASALSAIRNFGTRPEDNLYGSSLGDHRLLTLIEEKLRHDNAICCTKGFSVMVTAGANQAFLNVLLAITDPDDEIILPSPYYFNQEMAIRMLNCKAVAVETDANYQLQLDLLRSAITEKTRAIVTVSPNNPSGAVYTEESLRAVNELCRQHGLYHISDEAYEYFTYGKARHFSPASIDNSDQHTISLFSMSKAYGFASWRVGFVVFPKALLTSMLKVQDTNLICPPLISQHAAIGAMEVGSSYCKLELKKIQTVRDQLIKQLQPLNSMCDISNSEGAFYLLLKIHTTMNDMDLVKSLIDNYKVATIPGCAFGLHDGCYLRLSYGMLDEDRADVAAKRLLTGIGALC
jgi:aspartate/methionine/tyrosine aminotransferase